MNSENTILETANGSKHIVGTPLTTTLARQAAPDLLVSDIDRRVVTIRPMSTPIDQISRSVGARRSSSMVVEYYSVDSRPGTTTVKVEPEVYPDAADNLTPEGLTTFILSTSNDRMFSPTDTIMLPKCLENGKPLVLYVTEIVSGTDGGLRLVSLNQTETAAGTLPEIAPGDPVVRMGRAAGELDVQTSQFEALPVKS